MLYEHHLQNDLTVLVTTNTQDRRRIFSHPAFAREACEALYRVQEIHPFFLYAFVIMPDHCHILMNVSEDIGLSKVMRVYKSAVAHAIGIGPIWQSRFDAKHIPDLIRAKQYIHHNPVKAGLCEIAEEYPWSSASGKWEISDLPSMF